VPLNDYAGTLITIEAVNNFNLDPAPVSPNINPTKGANQKRRSSFVPTGILDRFSVKVMMVPTRR
jgi:hypothetical protein